MLSSRMRSSAAFCPAASSVRRSSSGTCAAAFESPSRSQQARAVDDAEDGRLVGLLAGVVRRQADDHAVHRHEEGHAERRDEVAAALHRREELEDRHRPDPAPAAHARPSRTTRRKMSSIGASTCSNRSIDAPASTSARSRSDGSPPLASATRHDPSSSLRRRARDRHGRQRPAGVHAHFRPRVAAAHFVDRAVDHQLPLVDQRHAIAERLDLVHLVRREDRRAAVLAPLEQQVLHEPHVDRIEPGRRLVEHADIRIAQERRGDLDLLAHALAEPLDLPGRDVRQFDLLEPHERAFVRLGARQTLRARRSRSSRRRPAASCRGRAPRAGSRGDRDARACAARRTGGPLPRPGG